MKTFSKFLISIISLFLINPIQVVRAESETIYAIDISSINDITTKEYVQSLYLRPEGDAYRLIVNNVSVGSVTNTGTLSYSPNAYVTIRFNIDIPNHKITFSSTKLKVESVDAILDFSATNFNTPEYQELTIKPNKKSGTSITLKAKLNENGWFYFDNYTYNYNGIGKDFRVSLNSADGKVYNNGTPVGQLSGDKTVTVRLWYEDDIQQDNYLALDYLKQFQAYPFEDITPNAQTKNLYTQAQVENALKSYTGDHGKILHNNATSDKVDFALTMFIYTRPRLNPGAATGDGVYGDEDGGKIQVICQWSEDACASVRSTFGADGRLFAVVNTTHSYNQNREVLKTRISNNIELYYPEDGTGIFIFPDVSKYNEGEIQIASRIATWTDYSNWTTDRTIKDDCEDNFNCSWKSKNFYRAREIIWSDYDVWSTSTPPSYACGIGCEYKEGQNFRYKYRTWSNWDSWTTGSIPSYACADGCEKKERSGRNPECGTEFKEYSYSNYGSASTSKYGYTEKCNKYTARNSVCGTETTYTGYKNCYGTKTGYTAYCSNLGTVTSSNCGAGTVKYKATCTCTTNSSKTCTGSYSTTKTACTISGCSSRRCSYTSSTFYPSCTVYSCPQTKTTSNKECTYYTCPNNRDTINQNKDCTSYSYKYGSWSGWNGWYNPEQQYILNNAIANYGSSNIKKETQNVRSYRYGTGYTNWSDYIYENCPSGQYVVCDTPATKYATKEKIWGGWSSFSGNVTSAYSPSETKEYKYRVKYKGIGNEKFIGYTQERITLRAEGMLSKADIYNKRNEFNDAYAFEKLKERIADNNINIQSANDISVEEYKTWINNNEATYEQTINNSAADGYKFIHDNNFVPYVYIRAHTRAVSKDTMVKAFNSSDTYSWEARYPETPASDGPFELEEITQPVARESKVIYYDYHDPLVNYEGNIPDSLEGLEAVINTLKNSNLESSKITMTISKGDIEDMREWLKDHKYSTGTSCELLQAFSYIFDSETRSRIQGQSCNIQ